MFLILIQLLLLLSLYNKNNNDMSYKLWKTFQVYHNLYYRKIKNAKIAVLWKTKNNKLFPSLPQNFNNSCELLTIF